MQSQVCKHYKLRCNLLLLVVRKMDYLHNIVDLKGCIFQFSGIVLYREFYGLTFLEIFMFLFG